MTGSFSFAAALQVDEAADLEFGLGAVEAVDVDGVVRLLLERADEGQPTSVGFPGATDIDYSPIVPLLRRLWNNVGDPGTAPGGSANTMELEREVITWCADLLAMPADDRWGYTTTGGTEGNLAAVYAARRRFHHPVVVHSRSAHYSIKKIVDIVGIPAEDRLVVDIDDDGEMDYRHLHELLAAHRGRPVIVVATAGTTMTEAVDDTEQIRAVLSQLGISRYHLHVDAALSGIPLALDGRLQLSEASGVDSVAISGHKFFGTPVPCGLVLMREQIRQPGTHIAYTATTDTTITGSRSGLAAAMLWYAVAKFGTTGHRARVQAARDLAAYTNRRLAEIGWIAERHEHAFTVVLRTPPASIRSKWLLATDGPQSHVICMPGITQGQMDALIADLAELSGPAETVRRRPT